MMSVASLNMRNNAPPKFQRMRFAHDLHLVLF